MIEIILTIPHSNFKILLASENVYCKKNGYTGYYSDT